MRSGPRLAAAVLLGVLLAQAAWIVAVPPFRGMDEFDHAFRASGVASGQWRLDEPAARGRGLLVEVPAELVAASEAQCEALPYIESSTCDGDGSGAAGKVRVTTSAANYVPVYYWVVGTAGEQFSGAQSLYAMRMASAVLGALLLAIAVWCLSTWSRGPWAYVGLLVGLSPTLVYTSTVVAPNGLEMAAGACLWTALLGLATGVEVDERLLRRERWLLTAATLSVVLLAGLRALGPLWVLLILACVIALRGPRAVAEVAGRHRVRIGVAVVLAAATSAGVLLWNSHNVSIPPGAINGEVDSSLGQAFRWPNWILGSIGAFPYRDQPAPLVVHLLVLLVLLTILVAAVRRGAGRGRAAVLLAAVLCLAVPTILVAATLDERGGIWQGRYSLPFVVGVMALAGAVLDRSRWRTGQGDHLPIGLAVGLAVGMLGVAHVVSVVHVQLAEQRLAASAGDAGWVDPPVVVTGLLMAAGWMVFALVALSLRVVAPLPRAEVGTGRAHEPSSGASAS